MFDSSCMRFLFFTQWPKFLIRYSLLLLVCSFSLPAYSLDIFLGTAERGSFSHFSGKVVCRAINKHASGLNCQTVAAQVTNIADNLTNLHSGSLDLALVDSRMLFDAVNKQGYFKFSDIDYSNLRIVLPMYDIPVTLIVRGDAGIGKLADLTGKRINLGSPRSGEQLMMKSILAQQDWTRKDFSLVTEISVSSSQDTLALCHGLIQSTLHIGVHPSSKLEQVFRLCGAKMASMNDAGIIDLVESNPSLTIVTLPSELYSEIDEDVQTFGQRATLVTSEALDDETLLQILNALKSGIDQLSRSHPALSGIMKTNPNTNSGNVAVHPASQKYFNANVSN